MLPDFTGRSSQREIIDERTLSAGEHADVACDLDAINRSLGGYRVSLDGVLKLRPPDARSVNILDVGAGYGDGARALVEAGREHGLDVRVVALDLDPAGLVLARRKWDDRDHLQFVCGDGLVLPFAERSFDVAMCSLVLHHCDDRDVTRLLRSMYAVSRWGIVVNDLHRHPLAWLGIHAWTRLHGSCSIVRHDGPLSVLRGFSRGDLLALCRSAGLPAELRWSWAFRWQLVARRATP